MKFVGLDLGGGNSLACVRDDAGTEVIQGSAHPECPASVLLPLVRKEKMLAGDEALRSERGSGQAWPPLAMTAQRGWSHAIPPIPGGRILLATVWQRLIAGSQWQDPQWQPPDGLPALNKPTPVDCLMAEATTVLKQVPADLTSAPVVLAIPNQLPEESQQWLLDRLPFGARLVWRSVAAAMSWAEANASHISENTRLGVLDAGAHGVEISVFEFRGQETDGQIFQVPIRRVNGLRHFTTETQLADSPAPFSGWHPDLTRLQQQLGEISVAVDGIAELLACGPMAEPFATLLQQRFPQIRCPSPDVNAVARGSCLFAWRLARDWPTYLDVLPSLELFTLTEEHEPKWLPLIPADCEVSGGRDFQHVLSRRIFIEKDTIRLASWLQRSGEDAFRKLSTDLPVQAAQNAWVDLTVSARSAGGFARVGITPTPGQFEVLGAGQSVQLNWHGMERVVRGPSQRWPVDVKFGWPACGKLYAHRLYFEEFLQTAAQDLTRALEHPNREDRMAALGMLKSRVAKSITPNLASVTSSAGDTAPVNLLVSFSTDAPCEFMEGGYAGRSQISNPLPSKGDRAQKTARLLWQRLKVLSRNARPATAEINAILYILGRMGGYAPDEFQNHLAGEIYPITKGVRLFAAGRVLATPEHGRRLFVSVKDKADFGQTLNNNWLRMLVYVLYQRPDILKEVPRDHVVAAAGLCLDVFAEQVQRGSVRILFMNSLRALALLLRARRHAQARDFLCPDKCPPDEAALVNRLDRVFRQATALSLRPGPQTLVARVKEWLAFVAATDEMPPIAPAGEEDDAEETNDD